MSWSRRAVIKALGQSAAGAALWPLFAACGPGGAAGGAARQPGELGEPGGLGAPEAGAPAGPAELALSGPSPAITAAQRAQLRALVKRLTSRFTSASALLRICQHSLAWVDAHERILDRHHSAALVLTGITERGLVESASADLSPAGILRAEARLVARADARAPTRPGGRELGIPRELASAAALDPRALDPRAHLEAVERLYRRAEQAGTSRVVYRAAYSLCDDEDTLFIGAGRDWSQRLLRTRAGALFVASASAPQRAAVGALSPLPPAGPTLRYQAAERAGLMGLEAAAIEPAQLARAADRALTLFAPTAPPVGAFDIVLDPYLAAGIVYHCVAPALTAAGWRRGGVRAAALRGERVGAPQVTLTDDPSAGGYGGYFFDDEGASAVPTRLIDAGILTGALTDRDSARAMTLPRTPSARRESLATPAGPVASHLVWQPNPNPTAGAGAGALIGAVERGYFLEGCASARADLRSWSFIARARRAYEIRRGTLTGAVYADVVITGDIPALLGAVRGLSSDTERIAYGGGDRLAASVDSPFVLTHAELIGA